MDFAEDFLVDQDDPYSDLDRFLFLSCRSCSRYSPFLIYLPPEEDSPASAIEHIFCAGCAPIGSISAGSKCLINNPGFLQLIQGYEYSNPFFRRYATVYRTLLTTDTRLEIDCNQFVNLPLFEKLFKLQELFPTVHLVHNRKFTGLSEISQTIVNRYERIRNFYKPKNLSKPTIGALLRHESDGSLAASSTTSLPSPSVPVLKQTARLRIVSSEMDTRCDICLLSNENNTIQFGPFVEKPFAKDIFRCHYLCLLSGTHIAQRGVGDQGGILGFLIQDVKQSFQIYRNKVCYCCEQFSAPVKCNAAGCDRYFHYICGYRKGCVTQFIGEYLSYCHEHLPFEANLYPDPEGECWICWDNLQSSNPVSCIPAFCEPPESSTSQEKEVSWFHRECLQKYAYEAGYYFKCPICHEKPIFLQYAKMHGIFVPMRDASWEIDRTYFKDLHECKCSAENCKYGNKKKSVDRMVGCKACGGETLHLECAEISDPNDYVCSKCMDATFIKLF
ncbi:PHD finger protein 7 [Aedes aegypti]|uniref:Uncharacterized protein n=1 Tax=Aedes aegypti TaxID=7159 RepID=A0A1S4FKT6_AEDAE|nr:PHD finger protein 7 [Aedes aegypti]